MNTVQYRYCTLCIRVQLVILFGQSHCKQLIIPRAAALKYKTLHKPFNTKYNFLTFDGIFNNNFDAEELNKVAVFLSFLLTTKIRK